MSVWWTAVLTAVLFASACGRGSSGGDPESPPSGSPEDDRVLARVGDREIRVRDLNHKIRIQLPAMAGAEGVQDVRQKRQVLQQMVDQYCWVHLAEEKGWDEDPEFRAILELSRKYILASHAAEVAVYEHVEPSEEELRAYYEENADQFRVAPSCMASQIVVATRAEAEEIERLLQRGASFEDLARERSLDRSAKSGGKIGTVGETADIRGYSGRLDINRRILDLGEGEFSSPIEVGGRWVLFLAYDLSPERAREFAEVRDAIREELYKKNANELFANTLAGVKEEAGVVVDEESFVEYAVTLLDDVEIQALASVETDPALKQAYYRGLIRRYPESPIAGQAQFMIGFVQADELGDYDAARRSFEEMIRDYPNDELAQSARWMLDNMDRGIEDDPYLEQIRQQSKAKRKQR